MTKGFHLRKEASKQGNKEASKQGSKEASKQAENEGGSPTFVPQSGILAVFLIICVLLGILGQKKQRTTARICAKLLAVTFLELAANRLTFQATQSLP